jgi:hypothetical protein
MLRVKSEETANILITKVAEYEVNQLTIMAQAIPSHSITMLKKILRIKTPNTLTIKFSNLENFPGLFSDLSLSGNSGTSQERLKAPISIIIQNDG